MPTWNFINYKELQRTFIILCLINIGCVLYFIKILPVWLFVFTVHVILLFVLHKNCIFMMHWTVGKTDNLDNLSFLHNRTNTFTVQNTDNLTLLGNNSDKSRWNLIYWTEVQEIFLYIFTQKLHNKKSIVQQLLCFINTSMS